MTIGYTGNLPESLWNPPPSTIQQVHRSLIATLHKALMALPIQQQTVIIAVRWDLDGWSIDTLFEPPPRGRYDGFAECLVNFDQYHGSIECIRQGVAEALADALMEQSFPGWRSPFYGQPDWEEDWN